MLARTLAQVTRTAVVDRGQLERLLEPRDGVVLERRTGDRRYEAAEGPVSRYVRTVDVEPLDDGDRDDAYRVRQTVEFRLALTWWGWLFVPLVRGHLGAVKQAPRRPWWAPVDRLDPVAANTLGSVMAMSFVVSYAASLLSQSMTFVAEDFGVSTSGQGVALATVRIDGFVALPLLALADRRGRRRMVMVTAVGTCVLSGLGALAPSMTALVGTQVLARGFATAASVTLLVAALEEMPRNNRAFAISLETMAAALGAGACIGLLFLADLASWRLLYAVTLLGLPLVRGIGRRFTETRRFQAPHPIAAVAGHGRRLWLLGVAAVCLTVFSVPASQFQNEYLRDERGFSATRISIFLVATNVFGAIGIVVGGKLADLRGRRVVASTAVIGGVGATVVMFLVTGWPMWAWSVIGAVVGAATVPSLGVYGPELFPTSLRGKANGVITGVARVGSVVGLVATGVLADRFDAIGPALAILAIGPAIVAVLIMTAFPETAHHELEDLNPEDRTPDPDP
jgi:MFS family permease